MTLKELQQLYYLNKEIQMDKQRLESLRAKSTSAVSPRFDGIPKIAGNESKIERYAEEIEELEAVIAKKQQQCIRERNRLERYISEIPDSRLRMIFTMRFVDGFSWRKIAVKMGGNNTQYTVSKACYRYIDKKN